MRCAARRSKRGISSLPRWTPTARKATLPSGQQVIFVDTVGFVSRLPHNLVEAFKSTLEEARFADIVLRVADASDPMREAQLRVTAEVLGEIGAADNETAIVYNKCDQIHLAAYDGICVSAKTGEGLDDLLRLLDQKLASRVTQVELLLPYDKLSLLGILRQGGSVQQERYQPEGGADHRAGRSAQPAPLCSLSALFRQRVRPPRLSASWGFGERFPAGQKPENRFFVPPSFSGRSLCHRHLCVFCNSPFCDLLFCRSDIKVPVLRGGIFMGYYRRYSLIYYTIALLCGALWLWMALVGNDSNFFVGLLLFFLVICLTAFFCSLAATRRFQAATQRLMQTADIASFLQELNGCAKSSRRNTYNTILFWQVYALQLAGNLQRAADLLQHADPNYARSARSKKNDRCAYSVRCASLALQLGQLDLADTHIESLRQELRTLQSDRALYPHYTKCLTEHAI